MTAIYLTAAVLLAWFMSCMFLIGLKARDNSLVDIAYGPAFLIACWGAWCLHGGLALHLRPLLLLALLTLWGVRLALHIGCRHSGRGEDFRYQKFREEWGDTIIWRSFLQIYMLQGAVILVVAAPVLLTIGAPGDALGWSDLAGVLLFSLGFLFEAISDWQLTVFKKGTANKGKIIMHGLWRYSRHPNYFGEATLWWGIFFVGLAGPYGLYGLVSPVAIAFLLLKVSGIPMLEVKYQGNPEFAAYKARTNGFFPWFERKTNSMSSLSEGSKQ
jgi:steroid 5-alpha reductase family enzyme